MDAEMKRRWLAWRIAMDLTARHPPHGELARQIQEETTYGAAIIDTFLELAEHAEDPAVREEAQAELRDLVSGALSDP